MSTRKAESMIETLVAITVIVISTISALSLMRTAISGNRVIEDKVIAINLAIEGLDAIKNMRDTNYLRFSENADECWDKINASVGDTCTSAQTMTPGASYFLTRNFSTEPFLEWNLTTVTDPEVDGNLDLYNIDFDRDEQIDTTIYAQAGISSPGFVTVDEARFKRIITFESLPMDALQITATVSWDNGGVIKEISLTRVIANVY
ncbi:MAG: hypothetical protein WC897_00905 [Candidatus Gracilibacteria bacterium]